MRRGRRTGSCRGDRWRSRERFPPSASERPNPPRVGSTRERRIGHALAGAPKMSAVEVAPGPGARCSVSRGRTLAPSGPASAGSPPRRRSPPPRRCAPPAGPSPRTASSARIAATAGFPRVDHGLVAGGRRAERLDALEPGAEAWKQRLAVRSVGLRERRADLAEARAEQAGPPRLPPDRRAWSPPLGERSRGLFRCATGGWRARRRTHAPCSRRGRRRRSPRRAGSGSPAVRRSAAADSTIQRRTRSASTTNAPTGGEPTPPRRVVAPLTRGHHPSTRRLLSNRPPRPADAIVRRCRT